LFSSDAGIEISVNQENQIDRLVRGGKFSPLTMRDVSQLLKALANEYNSGK